MTKQRQDAWSEENDLLLAETVLRHVREGSTQLNAFEEVGDKLNRTSAKDADSDGMPSSAINTKKRFSSPKNSGNSGCARSATASRPRRNYYISRLHRIRISFKKPQPKRRFKQKRQKMSRKPSCPANICLMSMKASRKS